MIKRRELFQAASVAFLGISAGCLASDNDEELEEIGDTVKTHFNEAERLIDSGSRNMDREEWSRCAADMEGAVDEINSAEREIRRGVRRAEDEGYMDAADALDLLLEYVGLMKSAVDELTMTCDSAAAGNYEEAEEHAQNAQDYANEYESMESDVEEAFNELED